MSGTGRGGVGSERNGPALLRGATHHRKVKPSSAVIRVRITAPALVTSGRVIVPTIRRGFPTTTSRIVDRGYVSGVITHPILTVLLTVPIVVR